MPMIKRRTPPNLPGPINQRYQNDQRRIMAEALMSDSTPAYTTTQGLAGIAKALIGKSQMGRVDAEYAQQGDAYNQTLAKAMQLYGKDPQAAIAALGSNPDLAPQAFSMQADLAEQQAKAQAEQARTAAEQARYEARYKAEQERWTRSEEARQRRFEEGQQAAEARAARAAQASQQGTGQSSGPFQGNALDAQAMNIYYSLSQKEAAGMLTPQEKQQLDLAKWHLRQPRVVGSMAGGFGAIEPPPLPGMPNAQPGAQPNTPTVTQLTPPNPAAKPATREERMDAGYAQRMIEAEGVLSTLGQSARPTIGTELAGGVPFVGGYAQTGMMTPDQQKYRQAQEDWVRAKLRKESGAAIGVDEMEREIKTYFPPPGVTDPAVIEQYKRARETAIGAMKTAAGAGMGLMSDGFTISPDQSAPAEEADPLGLRR